MRCSPATTTTPKTTNPGPSLSWRRIVVGIVLSLVAVLTIPLLGDPAGAAPGDFTHNASDLDFGTVNAGGRANATFVVTNTSGAAAQPVITTFIEPPFVLDSSDCLREVAVDGDCYLSISLESAPVGETTSAFRIGFEGEDPDEYELRIVGTDPDALTVEPLDHDFGDVAVGDVTEAQTVIRNDTAVDQPLRTAGGAASDFAGFQNCAGRSALAPGEQCELTYRFEPTTPGLVEDTTSYTVNGVRHPITLRGVGVPVWTVAPGTIDFGDVAVGESTTLVVTITNNSGADLRPNLSGTASDNPHFTLGEGTCLAFIASGESCVGEVIFTPTAVGAESGTLTVVVDGADWLIAMTGNGVDPVTSTDDADEADGTDDDTTSPGGADGGTDGEDPGDTIVPADAETPGTPVPSLPRTGATTTGVVALIGAIVLVLGALAITVARRFRPNGLTGA